MAVVVGTNSYISNTDADTYFDDALHGADWVSATETTQDQALVTAFRMLDRQTWEGAKTVSAQAQEFPRTGLTDKDGNVVGSVNVPQEILDGQAELALALIQDLNVQTNANTGTNVKEVDAKGVSVTFFNPSDSDEEFRFPTIVQELVSPFLSSALSLIGGTAFGSSEASSFDENYGLNNPYA